MAYAAMKLTKMGLEELQKQIHITLFSKNVKNLKKGLEVAATWHPCTKNAKKAKYPTEKFGEDSRRKLLMDDGRCRILAATGTEKCLAKGKVAFISADGIHQLHIFIFVLAFTHVLYCITTLALGTTKMRKWKMWEKETRSTKYQFSHVCADLVRGAKDKKAKGQGTRENAN